ncbi:hypothetical protein EB73_33980 [Mycobacterium sp. SWH-M3]|nr:hypothetical protein EB73_33980 [Mycobacterium sp. SWH-M3]
MWIGMSDNSFNRQVRRRQKATGERFMRARREVIKAAGAEAESGVIPESAGEARLLSLLGVGSAATAADVAAAWAARELPVGTGELVDLGDVLRVPLGLGAGGSPVWLDLKDDAAGGVGPHGVMIGATGSGKSTALQAMLAGLCARHSPDLLQLVLVDDVDSTVFDELATYPHTEARFPGGEPGVAGLLDRIKQRTEALSAADAIALDYDGAVSIVDHNSGPGFSEFGGVPNVVVDAMKTVDRERLYARMIDLVEEQMKERAAAAAKPVRSSHGPAGSMVRYHQVRSTPAGADLPAVPYTLVVIEDFDVLAHRDPGWVSVVDTVMRKGRHLGIGVLVVSQTLGSWGEAILANAQYRIALRTVDAETSVRLIGSDAAYHLPPWEKGVGLFSPSPRAEPVLYKGFQVSCDRVRDLAGHTAVRRAAQFVTNGLRRITSEHPELAAIGNELDASVIQLDSRGPSGEPEAPDDGEDKQPPAWRVAASNYPGSPVYAIVDQDGIIATDPLDDFLCVWATRATAEYQLSRNGFRLRRSSEKAF